MAYLAVCTKDLTYAPFCPDEFKRIRTEQTAIDAKNALKDFYSFHMISTEEYRSLKKQINKAKSDDEISGIMCRLRKRMYR